MPPRTTIHPLTPERWDDLVTLFGAERGAYGGCWCMYWRMAGAAKAFHAVPREQKRDAFRSIVAADDPPPGLVAYRGGAPAGWVQVGPRRAIPRFNVTKASRVEEGSDLDRTWAVSCFYIAAAHRRTGLMGELIDGAIRFARKHRARVLEAAPLDVTRKIVAGEGYVGIASVFEDRGFEVAARTSTSRPLMRLVL